MKSAKQTALDDIVELRQAIDNDLADTKRRIAELQSDSDQRQADAKGLMAELVDDALAAGARQADIAKAARASLNTVNRMAKERREQIVGEQRARPMCPSCGGRLRATSIGIIGHTEKCPEMPA